MVLVLLVLCCVVQPVLAPPVKAQTAEINTYRRHVQQGFAHLDRGDHRAARDAFEEALRYHRGDANAYLGLGAAYFHLKDDRAAERALQQTLALDPRNKNAYQLLGELAYRRDDLAEALSQWERALEIDSGDAALRSRLERVRREHRAEHGFNRDVTSHFSVKYEGRERIEAGRIVLRVLEDAYGEIGRALAFYPDREITVILYSGQQFREVTDAPGWSGGVFDGKIRLPIGGIEHETQALRRLLFHEYTHAVVRALTPRVPSWMNEGLAQYFEGRTEAGPERERLQALARAGKVPRLRTLEGSFLGLAGPQADLAYLVSLSAVRHLVERHGLYRIRSILDELAAGADMDRAFHSSVLVAYDDFEQDWLRSLA